MCSGGRTGPSGATPPLCLEDPRGSPHTGILENPPEPAGPRELPGGRANSTGLDAIESVSGTTRMVNVNIVRNPGRQQELEAARGAPYPGSFARATQDVVSLRGP